MEEKANLPFFVFESMADRMGMIIKRLVIALVICIIIIFVSNSAWLYAWMQYDYYGTEVSVDSKDGIANYIGGSGGIINGSDNSEE